MMSRETWVLLALLPLIVLVTLFGPREQSLGAVARIVYIHGALVWVAMLTFGVAGLLGLTGVLATVGLAPALARLHSWSRAAGRVALLFWVGYLPLSMWAAHAAWGHVFLEDPSFQNAFRILAVALVAQVIIWLRPGPSWLAGLVNAGVALFMLLQLASAQKLMHPQSPIGDSNSLLIQLYFYVLSALCALLAFLVGRSFLRAESAHDPR
jgi:hypothetical protein